MGRTGKYPAPPKNDWQKEVVNYQRGPPYHQQKGKNYDLENAHDSYSYRVGSTVTAYLANGRMYANEEGVRNATPQGTAYFAALIASFVMFFVTLILWSKAAEKKRAGKR